MSGQRAVIWLSGGAHRGDESRQPVGKTPLDILKKRFACEEINKEEFEERRRPLEND